MSSLIMFHLERGRAKIAAVSRLPGWIAKNGLQPIHAGKSLETIDPQAHLLGDKTASALQNKATAKASTPNAKWP